MFYRQGTAFLKQRLYGRTSFPFSGETHVNGPEERLENHACACVFLARQISLNHDDQATLSTYN